MLWIIVFISAVIYSVYGYIKTNNYNDKHKLGESYKDPVAAIICTIVAVFSAIILIYHGINGVTDYPYLVCKLAKAETLQNRIKDIRASSYPYKEDGELIAGSVENYKQSTNLSNYITQLSVIEANYNGYLEKCKAYKETFSLYFFGSGWAISDKIYDLKYITD